MDAATQAHFDNLRSRVADNIILARQREYEAMSKHLAAIDAGAFAYCPKDPSHCTGSLWVPLDERGNDGKPIMWNIRPSRDETGALRPDAANRGCPIYDDCRTRKGNFPTLRPNAYEALAIPKHYRVSNLRGEGMHPEVEAAARAFLVSMDANLRSGRGLWLTGTMRIGKTCAISYLASEAHLRGFATVWTYCPDLEVELRGGAIPLRIRDAQLLVIDDLGVAASLERNIADLDVLIEFCRKSEKSLLVSANIHPDTLLAQPDWARIAGRLKESCNTHWIDRDEAPRRDARWD